MKIDVVIPWVDGNDPVLNEKRCSYAGRSDLERYDVGGATRYANIGEIHYCIRSINRFASFVNKIFIVTDGQDPQVKSDIPVEIVDHKTIFEGYEEYLPVFNSTSIETMIHRIPGLNEHYILFNDDFFLIKETCPEDFFLPDGKVKCYTKVYPTWLADLLGLLSRLRDGYKRCTFKSRLKRGCELPGRRHGFFLYLSHVPRALKKSVFEEFYTERPDAMISNIRYKFRDTNQFQAQSFFFMLLWDRGLCKILNPKKYLLYILHWNQGLPYLQKKLDKADRTPEMKFSCFNSLDQASAEEQRFLLDWLEKKLA